MSALLSVHWTIEPLTAPQPMLSCQRCGQAKSFRSSGKFRLNANGRRIDAWLIYKCVDCDATWNRPVLERQNIRDIDEGLLAAFEINDPALTRRLAFDLDSLRKRCRTIREFPDVAVTKRLVSAWSESASRLEIAIDVSAATIMRTDRLVGGELGLSRNRLLAMAEAARLTIAPDGHRMLRGPVKHRMRVMLDLSREPDAAVIAKAAILNRAIGAID